MAPVDTKLVTFPRNILAYFKLRRTGFYHTSLSKLVESFGAGFYIYKEKNSINYLYQRQSSCSPLWGLFDIEEPYGNTTVKYIYQLEKLILKHPSLLSVLVNYLASNHYNSQAFIHQTAELICAILNTETAVGIDSTMRAPVQKWLVADFLPEGKAERSDNGASSGPTVRMLALACIYLEQAGYFRGKSIRGQTMELAVKYGKSPIYLYNTYCSYASTKDWLTPQIVSNLEGAIKVLQHVNLMGAVRHAKADLLTITGGEETI